MLSILIPVFRQDVNTFVNELNNSALLANIEYEIIIADDGSGLDWDSNFNELQKIKDLKIFRYSTNQGRSKIRNILSTLAKYDNLLFLDADGQLVDNQFINHYKVYFDQDIVSGGRIYLSINSIQDSQKLHYLYGIYYESKNANERNRNPFNYFHSNNFLVKKKIIKQFPFNENLIAYGYEDNLWALQLAINKFTILHIDNPVIHTGIEDSIKFIEKTKEALSNLHHINKERLIIKNKLSTTARFIIQSKFNYLFTPLYNLFENRIIQNLLSKSPNILLFQIFKLGNYLKLFLHK